MRGALRNAWELEGVKKGKKGGAWRLGEGAAGPERLGDAPRRRRSGGRERKWGGAQGGGWERTRVCVRAWRR